MLWRERYFLQTFYPQDYLQKKGYQLIFLSFLVCVIGGSFAFHAAQADEGDTGVVDGVSYLSPKMIEQLYDHPTLRQSGARSCRAIFVLGQRRAEQKVDVSATLSGERQLASNFKTSSNDPVSSQARGYDRNYDDVSRYGALEGEVVHVASNTTEEQNVPPYYETMIAIGDKGFPNSNVVPDIVPGMQVTVDIIGGERTVLDYILSPIQKAAAVAFREK